MMSKPQGSPFASWGNWLFQFIGADCSDYGNLVRCCVISSMVNLRLIFINIHSFSQLHLRQRHLYDYHQYELQRSYPPFIQV
jgi:hypothetical protein